MTADASVRRGRLGAAAILCSVACAAFVWPPAVPWVLAIGGWFLTAHAVPRVTDDRVCARLAQGSYALKVGLATLLYYASLYQWPIGSAFEPYRDNGFWAFADDAQAHHNLGQAIASAWQGRGDFPYIGYSNWTFDLYIGVLYRFLGADPLTPVMLNAWYGTLGILGALVLLARMEASAVSRRAAIALLGYWPSLVMWSTQLLKDPIILALILAALAAIVTLVERLRAGRPVIRLMGGLCLLLALVMTSRAYVGAALGMTALLAVGWILAQQLRRRQTQALRSGMVILGCVLSLVAAWRLQFPRLIATWYRWPTAVSAKPTAPPPRLAFEAGAHVEHPSLSSVVLPPFTEVRPSPLSMEAPPRPLWATGSVHTLPSLSRQAGPVTLAPLPTTRRYPRLPNEPAGSLAVRFLDMARKRLTITAIGGLRAGFIGDRRGSVVDQDVKLNTLWDVVAYLPRGLSVLLLAPFPSQWFEGNGRIGILRSFVAVEMVPLYALWCLMAFQLRRWRRFPPLPAAVLACFVFFIAVPMSLTVANAGTLFRLRLQFLLPMIVLMAAGHRLRPRSQ